MRMDLHDPVTATPSEPGSPSGKRYQIRPGHVLRDIAGEYLIIPVELAQDEASRMAVLNEEGKFLWEQLTQAHTMDELVEAMTAEFEVDAQTAAADIRDFLEELAQHQYLL